MASNISGAAGLGNLAVTIASSDVLDVREFSVHERISSLFSVTLTALSENPDIDFEAVVGKPARFVVRGGSAPRYETRFWTGVCSELHQIAVEESGLSTYHLDIVPTLWLTTQRRNYRMFQQRSELDIALQLLKDWGIEPVLKLSSSYKKRKYRVQYAESDFAFFCRMLEDAGISFYFQQSDDGTKLVLSDAPQTNELREPKIPFRDEPTPADKEHVTSVHTGRKVRPGRYTLRDHDYRRAPSYKLMASAGAKNTGGGIEDRLERYHYTPGAFLFESARGEETPAADDKGKHRTDETEASSLAQKRLDAKRGNATTCTFETNVLDLAPGVVMSMLDHPRRELGDDKRLLVIESTLTGTSFKEWSHNCEVRSADIPFRPPLETPKPTTHGVESATVVGPPGEEIHTDEFGRVRVHFHWDRESQMDDNSSCWIHVSQPWGGAGYGGTNLPRVGQEVLVDFLGGDPDRPIVVGRVYTNLQKVPYSLPANKTQSGLKSNSTGGGGGFNEIMFEDSGGNELLRMQAEKDMHKLVKNDEQSVVGRHRSRVVKGNEDITIGKNRTKHVALNERAVTGVNKSVVVGANRSTQVGAIDSTIVGGVHVVMVSPPGEGGGPSTSHTIQHDKIVLSTPGGASITMEGDSIRLEATSIVVTGKSSLIAYSPSGELMLAGSTKASLGSAGTTSINGSQSLSLASSGGPVNIDGGPLVKINGAGGKPAGRLADPTSNQILDGAITVLIGGPSLPFGVKVLWNGDIQLGNGMIITGSDKFKGQVLQRIATIANTKAGMETLNTINNSGKTMTIKEFTGPNSYCGPTDWEAATANGKPVFNGNGDPVNSWFGLGGQQTGTGKGSDTELQLNPDLTLPNSTQPGNPVPNDAIMFHEMTHGAHQMTGTYDGAPDGKWTTKEEENTILVGSPSEADYLKEIGYPSHRTDHDFGFAPN